MPNRFMWNDDLDAALWKTRDDGNSWDEVAYIINVDRESCIERAKALGINTSRRPPIREQVALRRALRLR